MYTHLNVRTKRAISFVEKRRSERVTCELPRHERYSTRQARCRQLEQRGEVRYHAWYCCDLCIELRLHRFREHTEAFSQAPCRECCHILLSWCPYISAEEEAQYLASMKKLPPS